MRKIGIAVLFIYTATLAGIFAWADEAANKADAVEAISIPVKIESKELRAYDVVVKMVGRAPGEDKEPPIDIDATYALEIQHQYGQREPDGTIPLEISASKAEATIGDQKLTILGTDFPKITVLFDKSYKITNVFGIPNADSANQMLGLNYSNLIVLFFVPDGSQMHKVGESWTSKVKIPGVKDEVAVVTTLNSIKDEGGIKTARIHQVWGWYAQESKDRTPVYNQFTIDSTFALNTGKLLKSHADTLIYTKDPAVFTQEQQPYKINTKIDISPASKRG